NRNRLALTINRYLPFLLSEYIGWKLSIKSGGEHSRFGCIYALIFSLPIRDYFPDFCLLFLFVF
ncbi:MAG: hypothetical protein LBL13_07180, partial [Bacteroidales bacterium]|nr:hypothetical protein [Bacteroidales bacterium]